MNTCKSGYNRPATLRPFTTALLLATLLSGCDMFEVVNPGPIIDDALNEESAGKTVLIGVVADVEVALDAMAWLGGPASTDLNADATQPWLQDAGEGRLTVTNAESSWNPMQLARWGGAAGIERLSETQSDAASNQYLTSAYMWAGWANRILGDNVCIAVFGGEDRDGDGTADPGEVHEANAHYTRALERFETARTRAQSAGHDSIAVASTAGMAQANLILGNYSQGAVAGGPDPRRLRMGGAPLRQQRARVELGVAVHAREPEADHGVADVQRQHRSGRRSPRAVAGHEPDFRRRRQAVPAPAQVHRPRRRLPAGQGPRNAPDRGRGHAAHGRPAGRDRPDQLRARAGGRAAGVRRDRLRGMAGARPRAELRALAGGAPAEGQRPVRGRKPEPLGGRVHAGARLLLPA